MKLYKLRLMDLKCFILSREIWIRLFRIYETEKYSKKLDWYKEEIDRRIHSLINDKVIWRKEEDEN